MDNLLDVVSARLKELFADETDTVTANKLLMTQGNLNKIKNGKQALTLDNLRLISEKYHVSADWILGLKEDKDINAISIDSLDYSQVFLILDKLHENGTVEPAQTSETIVVHDYGDEDDDGDEAEEESREVSTEGVDFDIIKIKDPAISFLIRRRAKLIELDPSLFEDWKNNHLKEYKGLPLLICDKKMQDYFLKHKTGTSDGDMSTALAEYINQLSEKNKDKENGEDK